MSPPAWLAGVFVAMMLAVAGFCAGRLIAARRTRRPAELDSDVMHVLMGVAMAGMLATTLRIATGAVWIVLFGGGAAWFGRQALRARRGTELSGSRCRQPVPHLLECGAMVYMLLALPAPHVTGGMPMGMTGSRFPVLSLLLAVFMIGYVVRLADGLTPRAPALVSSAAVAGVPAACARTFAPRCAMCCKIAMGITMAYLLVLML